MNDHFTQRIRFQGLSIQGFRKGYVMVSLFKDTPSCKLLICLFLILIIPQKLAAEELIHAGETLNVGKCIDISLKKHPQIIAAIKNVDANIGKVGQSKSSYYPQLKLNSGLGRNASPGKSAAVDEYSTSLSLSQNIFDFNRTKTQVDIQSLNLESSRADVRDVIQKVIFGVKQAYYELLRSKHTRDINAETVKQFEEHLETAKGLFEVGVKPKFDVTKAEVDLGNARLNLLKAENAVRIAALTLNNAIGMPDAPLYDVEDDVARQTYTVDLEESIKKANLGRPDIQSLLLKKEAARRAVELAKKDYYPVLSGNAGYGWSGEDYPLQNGWNIGASLNMDLFTGYSTKYKIQEAMANLDGIRANEDLLRQTIRLEVEQSCANLLEGEKRIAAAEITLRQAEENLGLAQGRYGAGVGSPLEVTDALITQGNARLALSGALYDVKIAEASLGKALGEGAK